jgi:hypothetical protein
MATYYIDVNRGSDSNSGLTKDLAWKSLEAIRTKLLTGTVAAGDSFLFEAESHFYPTRYLRIGSGLEPVTYINGTNGNPITFDKYDYSVATDKKPTFTLNHRPVSSDWQWDASKGLWYWTYPQAYESNSLTWGAYPRVTIGGQLCQVVRFESATFIRGNDPAGPLEVCAWQVSTPGRLYVWTPNASSNPITNPSNVYGDTIVAAGTGLAIFQFNRCGSYVKVHNLVAKESGVLVSPYNDSSGATDVISMTVENCEAYDCGSFIVANAVDSVKNIDGLKILNNKVYRCVGGAFMGGSKNLLIKGNHLEGMNLGRSDGGGFYITGAYSGYGGYIEDNTITDARYETGGCITDGCAIYLEAGSIGITVRRNAIYNCPVAVQDNSGKGSHLWHSNLIYNCDKVALISDQMGLATSPITVKFYNNTCFNITLNSLYPPMPTARFAAISCRRSSQPAANYTYDFKNNIIVGSGTTSSTAGFGFLIESGTTFTCTTNQVVGFSVVKADEYSFANPTTPATTVTTNPNLKPNGRLPINSTAINAGTNTTLSLSDKDNSLFKVAYPSVPSIGCYEYYPLNNGYSGYTGVV